MNRGPAVVVTGMATVLVVLMVVLAVVVTATGPTEPSTTLSGRDVSEVQKEDLAVLTLGESEGKDGENDVEGEEGDFANTSDVREKNEGKVGADDEWGADGKDGGEQIDRDGDEGRRKVGTAGEENEKGGVTEKTEKGKDADKKNEGNNGRRDNGGGRERKNEEGSDESEERDNQNNDTKANKEGNSKGDEEKIQNNKNEGDSERKRKEYDEREGAEFSEAYSEEQGGEREVRAPSKGAGEAETEAGVRAWLVVGVEEGWEAGRVEEQQLRDSAALFSYNFQVQRGEEELRCASGEHDDTLLVFLPRAEGVVQGAAGAVAAALAESGAGILLPDLPHHHHDHDHHHLHDHHHHDHHQPLFALAGWTRQVREAVRKTGVTSLTALARHLQENEALRRKCRAKLDRFNRVFHVLGDESTVGEGSLRVVGEGERYRVRVEGRTPPVLLATPSSVHARALLLALSDYLTGRLHPKHGCISCLEQGDWEPLTEEEEGEEEEKQVKEKEDGREEKVEKVVEMERMRGSDNEGEEEKVEVEKIVEAKDEEQRRTEENYGKEEKKEEEEVEDKKVEEEVVVVGVFVERHQPFLSTTLASLLHSGLHPHSTHFFIHNQVKEYETQVLQFIEDLRETGVRHVTLGEPVPDSLTMARRKNEILNVCKRLDCSWYLHWSATAFLNPGIPARLLRHLSNTHLAATHPPSSSFSSASVSFSTLSSSSTLSSPPSAPSSSFTSASTSSFSSTSSSSLRYLHPVLSPGLRVQQGIETTFMRGVEGEKNTPVHTWDHESIISGQPSARGHWHATCVKEVYLIPKEILVKLTSPYTHQLHGDANLALCATLRDAGVPMVVTTAIPNLGGLVNTTGFSTDTRDITAYLSNPDLWKVMYLNPTWHEIKAGNYSKVSRPCDEVYLFPTFNDRFCMDLLHLAYSKNKWSPALRKDPRKKPPGIESVPTVDQWLSDLGMREILDALFEDVFRSQLMISFPHSNPDVVVSSLVARFRPQEVSGLPSHQDASAVTFHVHLTPSDLYQGGELEFPRQKCRVKADVGEVLVFPGRLTHPKLLHEVTSGELNKLIIHIDLYQVKVQHY